MKEETDSRGRARDRVLLQLKTKGEQTSAQLARRLDVTPMAIRQHLAALEAESLVVHSQAPLEFCTQQLEKCLLFVWKM